jgi:hypothetical protein
VIGGVLLAVGTFFALCSISFALGTLLLVFVDKIHEEGLGLLVVVLAAWFAVAAGVFAGCAFTAANALVSIHRRCLRDVVAGSVLVVGGLVWTALVHEDVAHPSVSASDWTVLAPGPLAVAVGVMCTVVGSRWLRPPGSIRPRGGRGSPSRGVEARR